VPAQRAVEFGRLLDYNRGRGDKRKEAAIVRNLNIHLREFLNGKRIQLGDRVYWANRTSREIYAHSVEDEQAGSLAGYKVGDITGDDEIVICKDYFED